MHMDAQMSKVTQAIKYMELELRGFRYRYERNENAAHDLACMAAINTGFDKPDELIPTATVLLSLV